MCVLIGPMFRGVTYVSVHRYAEIPFPDRWYKTVCQTTQSPVWGPAARMQTRAVGQLGARNSERTEHIASAVLGETGRAFVAQQETANLCWTGPHRGEKNGGEMVGMLYGSYGLLTVRPLSPPAGSDLGRPVQAVLTLPLAEHSAGPNTFKNPIFTSPPEHGLSKHTADKKRGSGVSSPHPL